MKSSENKYNHDRLKFDEKKLKIYQKRKVDGCSLNHPLVKKGVRLIIENPYLSEVTMIEPIKNLRKDSLEIKCIFDENFFPETIAVFYGREQVGRYLYNDYLFRKRHPQNQAFEALAFSQTFEPLAFFL